MTQYLLLGWGFAFAASIQPGPLQAFLLSRVAAAGWRRALPACLSPLLSDGPIAVIVLLALGQLSAAVQQLLRAAVGVLLLYFAWVTFRQWRGPIEPRSQDSAPRTLFQATMVNVLNPIPYLGWALILGPSVLTAWRQHPANAVALIVAFYGTMVAMLGKKFAGILLEGSISNGRVENVVIGIGINVNQSKFSSDLSDRATSLSVAAGHPIDRIALFRAILATLEEHHERMAEAEFKSVLPLWLSRAPMMNRPISVSTQGSVLSGTVTGLTHQGALILNSGGKEMTFFAGDVTILK